MIIPPAVLSKIMNAGLSFGADFCEVYAEETVSGLMELKSSKTEYTGGKDRGVGLRLLFGNEEFYSSSNSLDEKSLLRSLKSLAEAARLSGAKTRSETFRRVANQALPPFKKLPFEKAAGAQNSSLKNRLEREKAFLQKLDRETRAQNSLISQNFFTLQRTFKRVQIANSDGLLTFDFRPYFRFQAVAVAEGERAAAGQKEKGYDSLGLSGDPSYWNEGALQKAAFQAAKTALQNLKAAPAPAGKFPVIINSGFGGVIFHEACGHGMETESVAEKASVFADKLGKQAAAPCVTAYDDGTLKGEYGSLERDDEGRAAQKTCLIEKGVLKNYMSDRLGAQKISGPATGSARRQNYKYPPASRMRNTYIAAGDSPLEEMISDAGFGLFAETLGGGSVNPGTGNYNFAVASARLIKNGRLDRPVKGASLIGNGLDTLLKIKKVGRDLKLAPGTCGSVSGWVPVTVGQPPLLVSELTVGGHKSPSAAAGRSAGKNPKKNRRKAKKK